MALMRRSTANKSKPPAGARESELLAEAIAHAVGCQGQGQWLEAETLYQHILKVRPRHFDALHLLGVLREQQGRSAEALGLLASALEVSPDSADAWSNRGVALKTLERWDEALKSYERALALAPDHVDALINRGHTFLKLRRFEDALASCDQALAIDPNHPVALNNRGHALVELKRPTEALAVFERALSLSPDDVNIIASVGRALQELGRLDQSLASYDMALARDPDHVESLTNRGHALAGLGRLDEALASLDRALTLRPGFPEGLTNRGNVLRALNRYDEAMADYGQALAIRPDSVVALNNLGVAFNGLNRCDDALAKFDKALAVSPNRAEVHFNRSLLLMTAGALREGWREYEWRWRQATWADRCRNFPQPPWLGQGPLAGKTILLHAEQGLGDTLQFVRYAPLVARRGARVILEVQPPLKALMADIEGIAAVVGLGEGLPGFDLHCPLMSLPHAFGTELDSIPAAIPYLHVPPDRLARWHERLGEQQRVRVGIAWEGSAAHKNNRNRSIALERFAALLSVPNVEFVSLQKNLSPAQGDALRTHDNVTLIGEELVDFADTAAVIELLDLVVSVDTSVVHLAGALGKPVWALLPFSPDFRWLLERADTPWYPSARLFRQLRLGDWESVLGSVRQELMDKVGDMQGFKARHAARPKAQRAAPLIQQAVALHQQGQLAEAERIYEAVLRSDPRQFDALHLSGVLKHQQGDSVAALRLVAAALKSDPKSVPALSNYGVILNALKRHEDALASFERALALKAGDVSALYNRGIALKALGRHEEAVAGFDEVLSRQSNHVDALSDRGDALAALGRSDAALESYGQVLALRPDHVGTLNRRGDQLGALKRQEEALAAYDAALAITPDHPEVLNNRAVTLLELKRPEEALASCDRALALRSDYADARYNRGNALSALGRHQEAIADYDATLTIEPNRLDALNNRGFALSASNRREEALACWEQAIAIEPGHLEALYSRARIFMSLERYEEALAAYDQVIERDPRRVEALSNRGLVLDRLARHEEALRAYDMALAVDPDSADILINRGNSLVALKKFEDALTVFHRALTIDPKHFVGHTGRGGALFRLKRYPEALDCYEKAVAIAPNQMQGYNNRGLALAMLGRHDEAFASYDTALEFDPNFVEALINRGNVFGSLGRSERALVDYLRALETRPDSVEARWNTSLAQLTLGNFREGWKNYEARWRKEETAAHRRKFKQPLWLGEEEVAGRTILLHPEQGLGDMLQFVRYAPLLASRGARVILEVSPSLKTLLAQVEGIAGIFGQGEVLPDFDLHCPMMSLPLACGTELATIPAEIPYIPVPADRIPKWRARLGESQAPCESRRLRVGIAWAGSASHINNRNRSIALSRFADLFSASNVEFVTLQKELGPGEAAALRRHPNVTVVGEELSDFADTAALISLLDLVVSVDTSVVHLAGAIGRPFWLLVPFAPDFRWLLEREDSPWYPTARLFRQPRINDWDSVLERVRGELERFAEHRLA
jgi:tetratricopeptide (TPR) repeat protein